MHKRLMTLIFCLCFIALGHTSANGQSSDRMSKALQEIIHAAPDKFEALRSSDWKPSWGGKAADVKKVGIPGMRSCYLYDKGQNDIQYACFMGDKDSPSQQKQLYEELKRSLPRSLPTWRFKEFFNDLGDKVWYFIGGPNGCPPNDIDKCPVSASITSYNPDSNPGRSFTEVRIRSRLFSDADLPTSAQRKSTQKAPPCDEQPGFSNMTLTVVTTVKPEPGTVWEFPEAPSEIAAVLLHNLNQNSRNIIFKEASGEKANLYLAVTLGVTTQGTRQTRAYVEVSGLGKRGVLFRETSGEAPFTEDRAAVNKLSANLLKWFETGWSKNAPCIRSDGSFRAQ